IFAAGGQIERALEHYLAAASYTEATPLLTTYGQQLIQVGRLDTLNGWLSSLPPHNLLANPTLLVYMGDIARLRSRFDEALGWYQRAEELCRQTRDVPGLGKALRGQARVFLDTVNPSRAEALLQEALSLADGQLDRQTRARLLDLLAENLLNQGRLDDAERFQAEARALREEGPGQAELPYRMMLRTGRLNEARQQLEAQAHQERAQPVQRPRAHRETLLLLSIILAFQGERAAAFAAAEEGTERGRQLNSPFVVAVGLMRQGHGWLLARDENGYRQAIECFQAAIGMSKTLEVARLRVEAYWGLTQAHGWQGQLEQAQLYADKGIALARQAGDEWISACIYTSLGASYLLTGRYEPALIWLNRAIASFQECSDTFGQTVARLWLGYLRFLTGDEIRLQHEMEIVLRLTHEHGYDFLFRQTSLLGPPDPRSLIPLLLQIRGLASCAAAANQLLGQLGLADLEYHPGYQLRMKTLGAFQVWRGPELVSASEWRRQAARQFLQLLLSQPQTLLHREQICEQLWPEATADEALNQFKVAYNSLCKVLEPDRARNAPSAFIARDGSRYGLRQTADVALDQLQFDQLIAQGDKLLKSDPAAARQSYERAIALYEGDFLVGFPYEPWAEQERLRLRNRFLRAAERLAEGYLGQGQWRAAQELADRMLQVDPCWEPAYRALMAALANLGNHGELLRTYQRCRETLARELAVAPAPATEALYQTLLRRGE
ncbi:MAG: tetratricopeptide repeat protein, partial [Anaerolineales bacterium]|nr:tetratricopeptide repeat protein [Anaerolineales bacterium]